MNFTFWLAAYFSTRFKHSARTGMQSYWLVLKPSISAWARRIWLWHRSRPTAIW
jgi:hypothetical protein